MRLTVDLLVAINEQLRAPDEFFDEKDELNRIERVLQRTDEISDPVLLAGALMSRVARSQAFTEGNKRTALAAAHFVLTANGFDPEMYLPPNGTQIRDCLVRAARGEDVEEEVIAVMTSNAEALPASREIPVPRPERGFGFHGLM